MNVPPPARAPALRAALLVVLGFGLLAPIAAGLAETLRAAFGVMPGLGLVQPGLGAWRDLVAVPGCARAVGLSLWTGLASTGLAVGLALGLGAWLHGRLSPRLAARWLVPLLAAPHAAVAIGLAFVLAPSGWLMRLVAPVAGWVQPPASGLVGDPLGLALILGLVVKELPFLLLVMLAALGQLPVQAQMQAGRSLGRRPAEVWLWAIVPQLWPLIRLPVLVVLAYGLSVVDMALILGPSTPPVLAVLVTRLYVAPDLAQVLPASAGAVVQVGLVVLGLVLVRGAERVAARLGLWWLRRGAGGGVVLAALARVLAVAVAGVLLLGALALAALALWSVAWRWPWPEVWPVQWSLVAWRSAGLGPALGQTLLLAGASTALALGAAVLWLEADDRAGRPPRPWLELAIGLPLLVPQVGFLYGLNVLLLRLGLGSGLGAVIWAQVVFVFPYVLIALRGPWRGLDPRLTRVAASMGLGPWRRLWRVKLPMLLAPVLTAAAIGVAVSVALYLPVLFMGGGRIATLTTEAVALASGSDRRVTAAMASLQALVPLAGYLAAVLVPALVWRNRAGMQGGAR
ncbi:MAG: ABC transporter permease [Gemmobacter sp.]|uniref:ABC transporter permease n=1 Tax=Gemmobacter sp. TaxID=1898957 RepID=UPI0039190BAA